MVIHVCPVCGTRHEVHPVLDRLAYGRQLTCSARCKTAYPQWVRARRRAELDQRERDDRRRCLGALRNEIN